jgi:hypothetical protein
MSSKSTTEEELAQRGDDRKNLKSTVVDPTEAYNEGVKVLAATSNRNTDAIVTELRNLQSIVSGGSRSMSQAMLMRKEGL